MLIKMVHSHLPKQQSYVSIAFSRGWMIFQFEHILLNNFDFVYLSRKQSIGVRNIFLFQTELYSCYRILKYIERMADQSLSKWEQIIYSPQNNRIPLQRWGHKLVLTNNREIFMFGGFGGENSEGKYLNDLWKFDLSTYQWKEIKTSGDAPQNRSNYTFHFNQRDNQLILFGGGSSSKLRFNNVCILHLNTLVWEKILPNAAQQAPWERTYHCSEFNYPYLIVHGGQGVSCIDLDDTWVFSLINKSWKRLQFEQSKEMPSARRFHCSALIDSKFYVLGGCKDNYELLGDMYRVDLKPLFEQGKISGLTWQKLISNNTDLQRWGHTCDVHNNKLYIFAGRINSTSDTYEMMVYDPAPNILEKMKISNQNIPKPRRRHATVLVGNCLLSFGGYNGKYLNDFYYIDLPKETISTQKINTKVIYCYEEFINRISKEQEKVGQKGYFLQIKTYLGQKCKLQTNTNTILENQYFRYMHLYASAQNMCIQLPSFCSLDIFRVILLGMLSNNLILSKSHPLSYYFNLIQSAEYFNCNFLIQPIEKYLISELTTQNCFEMLNFAMALNLNFLQFSSSEIYIKNKCTLINNSNFNEFNSCKQFVIKNSSENLIENYEHYQSSLNQLLSQVYKIYKFQIDQKQMRLKTPNFFVKTATKIKNIFSKPEPSKFQQGSEKPTKDSGVNKRGCLSKILNFLAKLGGG